EWERMFASIDILAAPTVVGPAVLRDNPTFEWPSGRRESAADGYIKFSAPANFTGQPSIQLLNGWTAIVIPIEVQIIRRPVREDNNDNTALAIEANTETVGNITPLKR